MQTLRFPFWLLRKTYPWMHIAILSLAVITSRNTQRQQQLVRLWLTVYKIDFSALLALAIDLAQPEFWV